MKPRRAALAIGTVLALALIAVGLLRPRSKSANLRCVESSTVGSLEVTDFDNPWGSKSLLHLSLVWNLGPAATDADRRQREIAMTLVSMLDDEGSSPEALPVGAVRLTASCDGAVHVVEVYTPKAPPHLLDCVHTPQPFGCARIWARDRYRGARPGAQAVVDKANELY